jgi:MFS family permease
MKNLAIDLTPIRKYRDFRYLWTSGLISNLGSMITYVAIPFQVKEITNSYLAVGISGLVELIPLIVFGLYGGVLADAVDRKKMIWLTEAAAGILSLILLLNALSADPNLYLIYIVGAAFAAVNGLHGPSADAILPRVVGHKDIPSATALMSLRRQFGIIVGPTIGGLLIASSGVSLAFAVDIGTYVISLLLLLRVRKVPPSHEAEKPSLAALWEGVAYARSRQDLKGTYIIDLAAMFLAMPIALFPFWVDQVKAPWALGLFYSAGTVGALVVTLTSGWTRTYRFHGRAFMWAAAGWGAAIALAGATDYLFVVLFFLAVAGGADMVSVLFRGAIWNQTIPDHLRGRLAGIELLSYTIGPLIGQLRAASMASATTLTISVTSGGISCLIFVGILAIFFPKLRKYDVQTDEYAVAERKRRTERENSPENTNS